MTNIAGGGVNVSYPRKSPTRISGVIGDKRFLDCIASSTGR